MALSGTQKTRIGASISAMAIKLSITAKAEGEEFVVPNKRSLTAELKGRGLVADYKNRGVTV